MVSVVIPTYKEPAYLRLCLQSLYNGIEDILNYPEVIVVVDGYMDLNAPVLAEFESRPGFRFLHFPTNQGLVKALNIGVLHARWPHVLIVNDDNVFAGHWQADLPPLLGLLNGSLPRIISLNQTEPAASIFRGFVIENFGNTVDEFSLERFLIHAEEISQRPLELTVDGGTFPFLMRRDHYQLLNGFDPMYPGPHVVDWDFFMRAELLGFFLQRVSKPAFYHFSGKAVKQPAEQARFAEKEAAAHRHFHQKWGHASHRHPQTNSYVPPGLIGIRGSIQPLKPG